MCDASSDAARRALAQRGPVARRRGRRDRVEDQVRIRLDDDPPQSVSTRQSAGMGMQRDKVGNRLDARFDMGGSLRRPHVDVSESLIELLGGPAGVSELHRPCFAQMALISSSLANSPRSASAKDSSKEAASSAVSVKGV